MRILLLKRVVLGRVVEESGQVGEVWRHVQIAEVASSTADSK